MGFQRSQWPQRRRTPRGPLVSLLAARSPFPSAGANQLSLLAIVNDDGGLPLSVAPARSVAPAAAAGATAPGAAAPKGELPTGRLLLRASAELLVWPVRMLRRTEDRRMEDRG